MRMRRRIATRLCGITITASSERRLPARSARRRRNRRGRVIELVVAAGKRPGAPRAERGDARVVASFGRRRFDPGGVRFGPRFGPPKPRARTPPSCAPAVGSAGTAAPSASAARRGARALAAASLVVELVIARGPRPRGDRSAAPEPPPLRRGRRGSNRELRRRNLPSASAVPPRRAFGALRENGCSAGRCGFASGRRLSRVRGIRSTALLTVER